MASYQVLGEDGQGLTQTFTWVDRAARATAFRKYKEISRGVLVDEDGDRSVEAMYWGKRYNPAIIIGRDGRIAAKFEFASDIKAIDQFLQRYLAEVP